MRLPHACWIALALLASAPAEAGSGANTRWFSDVNKHATVIRTPGKLHVVSGKTGYSLYDADMCRSIPPATSKMGRAWKSREVVSCTRDSTGSAKWKWTESELHLRKIGGKQVWTLHWPNDAREQKREVPELASYEILLDRIECQMSLGISDDKTNEWVSISAPFGMCHLSGLKGGKLAPGNHTCEGDFDNAFLTGRKVSLINRGTADQPSMFIDVAGRQPKVCKIVPEVRY